MNTDPEKRDHVARRVWSVFVMVAVLLPTSVAWSEESSVGVLAERMIVQPPVVPTTPVPPQVPVILSAPRETSGISPAASSGVASPSMANPPAGWVQPRAATPANRDAAESETRSEISRAPRTLASMEQAARGVNAKSEQAADESAAPTGGMSVGSMLLQTAGALLLVVGLIFGLKKYGGRWTGNVSVSARPGSVVETLCRVRVAAKANVILLKVGHRIVVVGETAAGLQTLANIDEPDELAAVLTAASAAGSGSITRSFSGWLGRFDREHVEEDKSEREVQPATAARRETVRGASVTVATRREPAEVRTSADLLEQLGRMKRKINAASSSERVA